MSISYSDLSETDKNLSKQLRKRFRWLSPNHTAPIISKCKYDADTIAIAVETKNGSDIFFAHRNSIDPKTYNNEREDLLKSLDEKSNELMADGTFRKDSSRETMRVFLFSKNLIDWLGKLTAQAKASGNSENTIHMTPANMPYWAAPQNAFRMMTELYIAADDTGTLTAEALSNKKILTLAQSKKTDTIFPDFTGFV